MPESVLFVTTSAEVAIDVVLEHHITLSGHLFKAKVMIGERCPDQCMFSRRRFLVGFNVERKLDILMLGINNYEGPLYAIELERAKDHLAFDNVSNRHRIYSQSYLTSVAPYRRVVLSPCAALWQGFELQLGPFKCQL